MSGNGSVVVGISSSANGDEAFRWTQAGGMVGLGDLAGGEFYSTAYDASTDGSVIVGFGRTDLSTYRAFRWTQAGGMVNIGGSTSGSAYGVSSDGSVVVGGTDGLAFRWTQAGGRVSLGDLSGGSAFSYAYDVSSDGSVVVGQGISASGTEAFRWTQAGGMVGLGDLSGGGFTSIANGVSGDGSTVVGYGESASGYEAFIWDASHGMRNLQSVLTTDYGLDLAGWTLTSAQAISSDGTTIVGYGMHGGSQEAWRAQLVVVPEPSVGVMLWCGWAALPLWRRRCRR